MARINAPETAQSLYGQHARRYPQKRLPIGRAVTLNIQTTDRFGRSLAKVKQLGDVSKSELVRCCGYLSAKKNGTEHLNFTAFYEALLAA